MWRGIIEQEKPLYIAIGLALKNVNSIVNLFKQVLCCKITILINAWFEEDPSFSAIREQLI